MKRIPWVLVAAIAAGCSGEPEPKSRQAEAAFATYRSDCEAAREECQRASDSARALVDGAGEDEATVKALDEAQKAIRSMAVMARDLSSTVEREIIEFASRDRQNALARSLLASMDDVRETTLPACDSAARALVSVRESLKRALATR